MDSSQSESIRKRVRFLSLVYWVPLFLFCTGCLAGRYEYGLKQPGSVVIESQAPMPSINFGKPAPRMDRMERFLSGPRRLVAKITGRRPMDEATRMEQLDRSAMAASEYLMANDLSDVVIEIRAYDPKGRWRRMVANDEIPFGWKYTVGTIHWLGNTVIPARLFRLDRYDPFSHTLDLNSGYLAGAVYESAQAKVYYRERPIGPGFYAALQYLPAVPVAHNISVANDALNYSEHHLGGTMNREMYPYSYSKVGASVLFETFSIFGPSTDTPVVTGLVVRGTGGVMGRSIGEQYALEEANRE